MEAPFCPLYDQLINQYRPQDESLSLPLTLGGDRTMAIKQTFERLIEILYGHRPQFVKYSSHSSGNRVPSCVGHAR
jgi:hypothetical protein